MTKTITELWYGQIGPAQYQGCRNPKVRELEDAMQCRIDQLKTGQAENKVILDKLESCVNEYVDTLSEEAFYDGFCLGMRFAAEALIGAEQIG